MFTELRVSSAAQLRLVLGCLVGMVIAPLCYGVGWFTRTAVTKSIPDAVVRFQMRIDASLDLLRHYPMLARLIDTLATEVPSDMGFPLLGETADDPRGPRPKPTPPPSVGPSVLTSPAASAAPSPSPRPRPSATPNPAAAAEQVTVLLSECKELPLTEKPALKALVKAWKRPGPGDVLALAAAIDRLVFVDEQLRRGLNARLFGLSEVSVLLKLGSQDDADRLALTWDIADLMAALSKGGTAALARLLVGRPLDYYLGLIARQAPYLSCREQLAALAEGKARPATSTSKGSVRLARCLANGTYTAAPDRQQPGKPMPWRCSEHQTLEQPFRWAAQFSMVLEPVEKAMVEIRSGQLDAASQGLSEVLRLHPNHPLAADAIAQMLFDQKRHAEQESHLKKWLVSCPDNARWNFMMAVANQAVGDPKVARQHAQRAMRARYEAPPPNVASRNEFYVLRDRAEELLRNSQRNVTDYEPTPEAQLPTGECLQSLQLIRSEIERFCHDWPNNHPDMAKLKQVLQRARDLEARTPAGPGLTKILGKKQAIEQRIAQIEGDVHGKEVWKYLAKFLNDRGWPSCRGGGRYAYVSERWLDCTLHPSLILDHMKLPARRGPTDDEMKLLSQSLLVGVLAGDERKKACFDMQRDLINAGPAGGLKEGDLPRSTVLGDGRKATCSGEGTLRVVARGAGKAIECTVHGAGDEYLAPLPPMKEPEP